jgi:hypothetical protein
MCGACGSYSRQCISYSHASATAMHQALTGCRRAWCAGQAVQPCTGAAWEGLSRQARM